MPRHAFFLTIFAFILLTAANGFAANHYILQGASGSGNGSDWTNACKNFAGSCAVSSLVRGDTYYVGVGSYSGPTFNTATSGTTLITIKRATVADHGTSTGWSDSFASGTSTFLGGIVFTTGYWTLDGQTGGGPGSWTSGFGIAITQTAASPMVEVDNGANNVTVRHVDVSGNSNSSGGGSIAQDAFAIKGGSNFTASYYYTHGVGRCPFFCGGLANACPGMIAEYGYIADYVSGVAHSEVLSDATMSADIDFRYNVITHIEGTGGLMWDNSGNHNAQFRVYGNVFYRASGDNTWNNTANGLIGGWTGHNGEDNYNMRVYNNTFINITGTLIFTNFITRFGNNVVENNLFYNSISPDYTDIETHDYNYYINSGGAHSEANAQTTPTTNPFTNYVGLDFSSVANTNNGLTLPSPYTTDPAGHTRGLNGVWDRGAYEFVGGGIRPNPPTNLTTTVQ